MTMKIGTQVITFRVQQELKDQIEREAERQGRSVNNLLQHMVTVYLKAVERKHMEHSHEQ